MMEIAGVTRAQVNYADDLKLLATCPANLDSLFCTVLQYLQYFGLHSSPDKCHPLAINSPTTSVWLKGVQVPCQETARFLGVMFDFKGNICQPSQDYREKLFALDRRLRAVGLHTLPSALMKAYNLIIAPGIFFGGEVWGLDQLHAVVFQQASPYKSPQLKEFLNFLKKKLGLPSSAFYAAVYRLFNVRTLFQTLLPRLAKVAAVLSPTHWHVIATAADTFPRSQCAKFVALWRWLTTYTGTPIQATYTVLSDFWKSASDTPGRLSRHAMIWAIFGIADCEWVCMRQKVSTQTLHAVGRLFALQHPYFFHHRSCTKCTHYEASLQHLLCECPALAAIRERHHIPDQRAYLRVYLLRLSGTAVYSLAQDVMSLLDTPGTTLTAPPLVSVPRCILGSKQVVIRWDGSYAAQG